MLILCSANDEGFAVGKVVSSFSGSEGGGDVTSGKGSWTNRADATRAVERELKRRNIWNLNDYDKSENNSITKQARNHYLLLVFHHCCVSITRRIELCMCVVCVV